MLNNLQLITPLISFNKKGDFIRILILKRKKDQTTDKSNHQSVRTIKSYLFYSIEQLIDRYEEIIKICEFFKARCYIDFNVKNDKNIQLKMLSQIVKNIENGSNKFQYLHDSIIGKLNSSQKRWIVDIDGDDVNLKEEIINHINSINPIGNKIIAEIPTKEGIHLIVLPFDLSKYDYEHIAVIHKKNPTVLYIPESLN